MTEAFYDPTQADHAEDTLFRTVAAAYVQDVAPVPDPEPEDYADKAAAAEYLVLNYLNKTKGATLSSQSARGLSLSLTEKANVEALIAPVMGQYYEGSTSGALFNTAYLEDFS